MDKLIEEIAKTFEGRWVGRVSGHLHAKELAEGLRPLISAHVESETERLKGELDRYKKAAETIFDDPVGYMENKSVRWRDRAEKAEGALATMTKERDELRARCADYLHVNERAGERAEALEAQLEQVAESYRLNTDELCALKAQLAAKPAPFDLADTFYDLLHRYESMGDFNFRDLVAELIAACREWCSAQPQQEEGETWWVDVFIDDGEYVTCTLWRTKAEADEYNKQVGNYIGAFPVHLPAPKPTLVERIDDELSGKYGEGPNQIYRVVKLLRECEAEIQALKEAGK
jgi:hypothetical protein